MIARPKTQLQNLKLFILAFQGLTLPTLMIHKILDLHPSQRKQKKLYDIYATLAQRLRRWFNIA